MTAVMSPSPASVAPLKGESPNKIKAVMWIATSMFTGAIVMAMELAALRLYAPYFGNSIYVWGSAISVVMVAMSAGYGLGGWLADRSASDAVLYLCILASGAYQVVFLAVETRLLRKLLGSGEFWGPVLATILIFGVPITILAMTSPFVIRLLVRAGHVGKTVGSVFGLSTAASIVGTLGTSFVLIPRLGTRATLELLCAVCIGIGVIGLAWRVRAVLLVAPLIAAPFMVPKGKPFARFLWSGESAYNRLMVFENRGLRWLVLNDPHYFATIVKVDSAESGYYLDEFALGPVIVPAKNLLVLGLGAGRSVQVSRQAAPELEVDAVEIDREVVKVAEQFFGLPRGDSRLHVHVADARPWLAKQSEIYDLAYVDLFQGGPYVPFYLTTVEFFGLVRSHMKESGGLILNVYDPSPTKELLETIGASLRRVFPSLELLSNEDQNYVLVAFAQRRPVSSTVERLEQFGGAQWIQELARKRAKQVADFEPSERAAVFTDDLAPIEEVTHRVLRWAPKW